MKRLAKLQAEYNRLHEQLGYMRSKVNIAAVNRRLEAIVAEMGKIIASIK